MYHLIRGSTIEGIVVRFSVRVRTVNTGEIISWGIVYYIKHTGEKEPESSLHSERETKFLCLNTPLLTDRYNMAHWRPYPFQLIFVTLLRAHIVASTHPHISFIYYYLLSYLCRWNI